MQTAFTEKQLADSAVRASEAILRKCVHCGFCSATCPTYQLVGDELDSPRGRIYLIKDMLENDRPASPEIVRHIDRCLSCLACMTTCPSGVNYQHLVDHARVHIERSYRRPWHDRWMRSLLASVMPYPARFRLLLAIARLARPLAPMLPSRLGAALALVPRRQREAAKPALSAPEASAGQAAAAGEGNGVRPSARPRIAFMTGCVQSVLGRSANAATRRLLERMGCEVVEISGCCGSLTHHLGRDAPTRQFAASFVGQLAAAEAAGSVAGLVTNASGCGTHLKDLGFVLREDAVLAEGAARVASLARDVTELVSELGLPPVTHPGGLRVAYHSACSMQHGQRLSEPPRALLRAAGFEVVEIPEGHLCCGSAGTYNMLQPELAGQLAERKLGHIASLDVDLVAAGNLGCITQLGTGAKRPVVHTVELLDWATGGPVPVALDDMAV